MREELILVNFREFIREGVKQGIIRGDINLDLTLMMFVNCIQSIINPKTLSELPYSMKEVFDSIVGVIFNGILAKGHAL
jgi:hypothetical protein